MLNERSQKEKAKYCINHLYDFLQKSKLRDRLEGFGEKRELVTQKCKKLFGVIEISMSDG